MEERENKKEEHTAAPNGTDVPNSCVLLSICGETTKIPSCRGESHKLGSENLQKNDGFGTLSNNCTLFWRQANYEIEMLKTKASRPLLELSMQKIHATVAPDSSCWDSS